MNNYKTALRGLATALCFAAPAVATAADTPDGYWAGGYVNSQSGEIQFELTMIDGIGQLKYNASNWGALGFAICEYVFPLEGGQPGKVTRNSGAGTGDCLAEPAFTFTRPTTDVLAVTFKNPEFELDAVELAGILRPFDPAQAHAPVAGLDILGAAPGMTFEQIDAVLTEKGYARAEDADNVLEFEGFTQDQRAWSRSPDENGTPTDWVHATFTAKKDWLPEDTPVAADLGRDWNIPTAEGIAAATMADTLAKKYGPRSNSANETRMYDRAGQVMLDTYSCPEGTHQPIPSHYTLRSETGTEEVSVTCGPILTGFLVGDSQTGRAMLLKLRITDPDLVWKDFWATWSHSEGARLKLIYDGVTGATGAAPEL